MKISFLWLKDFVEIDDLSPDEVANPLTALGLEVEAVEYPDDFVQVVVGKVISCDEIPRTKNKKCIVDVGEILTIVCGAPNIRKGVLVPVVKPGGRLPGGTNIETAKIAGVISYGMICSEAELGLGTDNSGIWILDNEQVKRPWEIGSLLHNYFPPDAVFKLEITHNRPDCLSHLGAAREIAAGLNRELKYPAFQLYESPIPASEAIAVEILDPERCPRYCGRVVKGITVKPSPRWMQRRLLAVGLRPINNIVDVTNYILMESGHPLHAFDLKMIAGNRIVVKTAQNGEMFTTLDENEHPLTSEDLLICDGEKGVALAGVMGGLNSEISDDTEDILLECAYFDPVCIRKTSKRLGIVSESSYRFERGVDPNAIPNVIDRTAYLVKETGGGEIHAGRVDSYPGKIYPVEIKLRPPRVNFILGLDIEKELMSDYLERLELEVIPDDDNFRVKIPTFRPDLKLEIDLIEEIARIHGYDRFPPVNRTYVSLEVEPLKEEDFDALIRQKLAEEGMQEVLTHSMRHPLRAGICNRDFVKIRNPISADFAMLRCDLYAPLLEAAAHNLNRGAESVRIFELGHIFRLLDDGNIEEFKQVAGLLTGFAGIMHWSAKLERIDFIDLKGLVNNFLNGLSLDNYRFSSYLNREGTFEYAQSVLVPDEPAGEFGLLKKETAEIFEIEQPVFLFSLNYRTLFKHHRSSKRLRSLSRFPAVKRDLSLVFDEAVTAEDIENNIRSNSPQSLISVEFFDLFRSEKLGAGKKSVSLALRFQSMDRTLTDDEVDSFISRIIKGVESIGGELRKI